MENNPPVHVLKSSEFSVRSGDFNPAEALDLEAIEELRERQLDAYTQAKQLGIDFGFMGDKLKKFTDGAVEGQINSYLLAQGLDETSDQYDTYKSALMDLSVVSSFNADWEPREGLEPGESGIEKAQAYYRRLVDGIDDQDGSDDEQTEDTETTTTPEIVDPYIEAEHNTLVRLREQVAKLSAKRQGRLWGDGGEAYSEAVKAYNAQVVKLGKLEKKDTIEDETISEVTKKAEIVAYLLQEQNELRKASVEKLENTAVSKFVDVMTRGNIAQRIAKGALLGLGASVVAAGAGAVIGVAGGAAIVGGVTAGIVGAARFARGYARSDGKRGRGMQQLNDSKHLEEAQDVEVEGDNHFDAIFSHFQENYEKDIDKEQAKRRRSVIAGLGGIAIGTGIGTAVALAADALPGIEGWFNRGPSLPFADQHAGAEAVPQDTPDGGSETGAGGTPDSSGGSDAGSGESAKTFLQNADTTPEATPTFDPNFAISSGEGGIHFFQDLGLTESNWYEVQNELLQNYPNDFYSMGDGNVGLAHPGQLSLEAQQFIKARFSLS